LEVQFLTPHLESLGAIEISDLNYQQLLIDALAEQPLPFA
jgi:Leu/Phe-tRNA-protein transferase